MKRILLPTIVLAAAGLSLAACQKSPADAQADAVRTDSQATATAVDAQADAIEDNGEKRADAIEAGKVPPAPIAPKP